MLTPESGFSTVFCQRWHEPTVFKPTGQRNKNGYMLFDVSAISVIDGSMVMIDRRVDLMTICASYGIGVVSKINDFDKDTVREFRVCNIDIRDSTFQIGYVGYPDEFIQEERWSSERFLEEKGLELLPKDSRIDSIRQCAAVWNVDGFDWTSLEIAILEKGAKFALDYRVPVQPRFEAQKLLVLIDCKVENRYMADQTGYVLFVGRPVKRELIDLTGSDSANVKLLTEYLSHSSELSYLGRPRSLTSTVNGITLTYSDEWICCFTNGGSRSHLVPPNLVQQQLCQGMNMKNLTRSETLAEETSGIVFLPTNKQNIYLPRCVLKNDAGTESHPAKKYGRGWFEHLSDYQLDYYQKAFNNEHPGCAAGLGCLCRKEFLDGEADPRLWRTIYYCHSDDSKQKCITDDAFNRVEKFIMEVLELVGIGTYDMEWGAVKMKTFCVVKSGGKCIALAIAGVDIDESIVCKIETVLKKQRFRYNANVHLPKFIHLFKGSSTLCADMTIGDSVFFFDDQLDRYVIYNDQPIELTSDTNIYYSLPCNKAVQDVPRIWYHAACLNARREIPLRHCGNMIHECEYCSEQLHITTLSPVDFTFVDGPWKGRRPLNSLHLFGMIDVIAGWQNFDMYRTLPMTHLGLSKYDTVEKRDDGKFYLTRNGKEFFPEQMTIDRSSGMILTAKSVATTTDLADPERFIRFPSVTCLDHYRILNRFETIMSIRRAKDEVIPVAHGEYTLFLPRPLSKTDLSTIPNRDNHPIDASPIEITPIEITPIETAPIVDTTPIETAPIETAPIETAPIETAPIETAPIVDTPIETVTGERLGLDGIRTRFPFFGTAVYVKKDTIKLKRFHDFVPNDVLAIDAEYSAHVIDIRVFPKHPKIWCEIAWADDDNCKIFNEHRNKSIMPLEAVLAFGQSIIKDFFDDDRGKKHPQRAQILEAIKVWKRNDKLDRPEFLYWKEVKRYVNVFGSLDGEPRISQADQCRLVDPNAKPTRIGIPISSERFKLVPSETNNFFVHDSQTGDKFCVGPGIDGAAHVFPDGSILDMVLRIWFLKKHPYHFLK